MNADQRIIYTNDMAEPTGPLHINTLSNVHVIEELIQLPVGIYIFGTNTRNRARPRTFSKLWSAKTRTDLDLDL